LPGFSSKRPITTAVNSVRRTASNINSRLWAGGSGGACEASPGGIVHIAAKPGSIAGINCLFLIFDISWELALAGEKLTLAIQKR
jgi:hypothetical protein